jgi:quercetin 2,3-dioxygenase
MLGRMLTLRRSNERGHVNHGWLDSHHTFSFGDYYDGAHMGFRGLRVLNEDRVEPGHGFPRHPHRDMEILSYVLAGGLEHRDSMGNGSVIRPGDVQRMSAGTGVTHSEKNASSDEPVHFLQIWMIPSARGLAPSYEQKAFGEVDKRGRLRLVASPDGRDGSVTLHCDIALYASLLDSGQQVALALVKGRHGFIHVARGRARVQGQELSAGDAVAISDETSVTLEGLDHAEILAFDLA